MAYREASKFFYRDRWSATDAPSAASAATVVSPALRNPNARHHLESIWYSIWNSNAASTIQAQVRVASAAGTLLASIDHIVATSTVASANAFLGIPGKRGKQIWASFNTAVASLTTKVTIAGWTEDVDG